MRAVAIFCLLILTLTLIASPADADRVVLRNGGNLSGKITRETADEIDLTLSDGMRMTIRRSRIKTIEREVEDEADTSGDAPVWTPRTPKPDQPEVCPGAKPDRPRQATIPRPPGPYENPPFSAWNGDFGRYPVIMASKTTRFRAYRLIRRNPLAVDPNDKRYAALTRRHGHGGTLSVWEFEYAGMLELRYGDQVRFIGELTTPTNTEDLLIRLKLGPIPVTPRLSVFLVKRGGAIKRYATTTVFAPADFRQEDLKRLPEYQLNVRTYQDDYIPIASNWIEPARTEFLAGMNSPMGDAIAMRILRYRFRLDWFELAPEDRPALDPDLITRGTLRPLAKPGRPVADEMLIRRAWGTAKLAREQHNQQVERLRKKLATLNIRPDRNYIVECERLGVLGARGVTLETRRYHLTKEQMKDLLTLR